MGFGFSFYLDRFVWFSQYFPLISSFSSYGFWIFFLFLNHVFLFSRVNLFCIICVKIFPFGLQRAYLTIIEEISGYFLLFLLP